jgi:hypothetical protein
VRDWNDMLDERDSDGKLTALAMALNSVVANGCDCGEDEPWTCIGCLFEQSLHEQFDEIERLRHENADIKREAEAREEEADKLRLELANTSSGNAVLTEQVSELERENADLRRQLKAAKGEAQRTVYVAHNFADESKMLADLPMPGACYATSAEAAKHIDLDKSCAEFPEHVTAVTLTARKVGKP